MGKSSGSESDRSRKRNKNQRDKRQNSRSRSPASSSSRSSSRSRSISKHQSRRRSKRESRSRSPARSKRNRRSRSRSKDKSFKSHSKGSSSRTSSYSSSSRSRRRSRSRSRSRDRKDSRDNKRERDDKSTQKKSQDSSKKLASPPSPSHDKNADDQLKVKLQMALKAAADADALLREQGVLTGGNKEWGRFTEEKEKSPPKEKIVPSQPVLITEQLERAKALDNINAPGFHPQSFTSGKTNPTVVEEKLLMTNHDAAIFGTESEQKSTVNSVETEVSAAVDKDSAAHENLFIDLSVKEERWIKKLMYMRQRKLNGEAMF